MSGIAPVLDNSYKKILVEARYLFFVDIEMSVLLASNFLNLKKLF
jgi:uncharacterized FlgJ-related protein